MNKNLKEQILELRTRGFTYNQISDKLKCSKGTISYHLGDGQKEKYITRQRILRKKNHPFKSKMESFSRATKQPKYKQPTSTTMNLVTLKIRRFSRKTRMGEYQEPLFTVQDVIAKFGKNPTCYLTGEPIDINQPRTYHFDHRVPRSRGGDNSLDNLEICTKKANSAKSDMTVDELTMLCKSILEKQGYSVSKYPNSDSNRESQI